MNPALPKTPTETQSSPASASGLDRWSALATTLFITGVLAALLTGLQHRFQAEIAVPDLEYLVRHLAGDVYRGRESGTEHSRRAARYIADYFEDLELTPAFKGSGSDERSAGLSPYLQSFSFEAGVKIGETNEIRWTLPESRETAEPIRIEGLPLPLSAPGTVSGELVFLGHCLQIPQGQNDFAGRNLRDKIVVCLRYGPGGRESSDPALRRAISFQAKHNAAGKAGAAGVLFLNTKGAEAPAPEAFRANFQSGPKALFVEEKVFFQNIVWLAEAERQLHKGENIDRLGAVLGAAAMEISYARDQHTGYNVGAWLRPPNEDEPYVVLGAHLDHLGRGNFSSLGGAGQIHYGADDNASGTAALMETAHALAAGLYEPPNAAEGRPSANVLFVLFDGEERGLFGSRHFANSDFFHPERAFAMINLDMVGRLRASKGLSFQGADTADPRWKAAVQGAFAATPFPEGVELKWTKGGAGPSDHASFYQRKVPVGFFFTGGHKDYHRPSDTAEKVNYAGLAAIAELNARLIRRLQVLERPLDYRRAPEEPSRRDFQFRVRLGIMPGSYESGGKGLEVGAVSDDAPVAATGIQAGDLIIQLGEQRIRDIDDLMDFLSDASADRTYTIVYEREGRRFERRTRLEAGN